MSNGYIFEGNLNSSDNVTSLEETFLSDFDFNGLRRGDRIQVFLLGIKLMEMVLLLVYKMDF
ncbi:hypothetical protein BMG_5733 (plasmid) [Priestia megaterium]|uniref:hypothetical protein n=1 Tax=Priestia megaterium TaxID=1404 RepID=UPI0015DBDF19|nr:hypothetical protein [Priestia megaterium]QLK08986.1 hypothetical protein BMG_5733 [Priestia megaterium]